MEERKPSSFANLLLSAFERAEDDRKGSEEAGEGKKKITVNPVISEVASWYEKLRTAMDIREEEVILRGSIERIVKRRILLGGTGKTIAGPLVRELIWARYFPDASVPETIVGQVEKTIDLHMRLRDTIGKKHKISQSGFDDWFYHLLSSDLVEILAPNKKKDTVANFMFQILRDHVTISDDTHKTRDAQVFIAVRKAFAKDDIAYLRYHLFSQYFGKLTEENLPSIAENFITGFNEIEQQLRYPLKEKIFNYVKNKTAPFFILEDILTAYDEHVGALIESPEHLKKAVFAFCQERYKTISGKIQRAIFRSVIFILLTKAIFAFAIEGTYETLLFGKISWDTMVINVSIPPLLMIIVGLFMRTPGKDNSERIFDRIEQILFSEKPVLGETLQLTRAKQKSRPTTNIIFTILWFLAFLLSFGILFWVLNKLDFHIVSQGIFIFFLTIVSFLSYRISQTAGVYYVDPKPGILTPVVDFAFLPIIQVGRHLTEGIAQLNLILFIFDFIIETPFKGIFGFFEQWFLFLHAKRENLG